MVGAHPSSGAPLNWQSSGFPKTNQREGKGGKPPFFLGMKDPWKMSDGEKIDFYFAVKNTVHKIFEYEPDWVEIPMDDERGKYWMLSSGEGYESSCVWSDEPLTKESIVAGNHIYSGTIYTQRFLPKWVYRAEKYVMVAVDTMTDGNKFLKIFDADKECTDDKLRELWKDCWGLI